MQRQVIDLTKNFIFNLDSSIQLGQSMSQQLMEPNPQQNIHSNDRGFVQQKDQQDAMVPQVQNYSFQSYKPQNKKNQGQILIPKPYQLLREDQFYKLGSFIIYGKKLSKSINLYDDEPLNIVGSQQTNFQLGRINSCLPLIKVDIVFATIYSKLNRTRSLGKIQFYGREIPTEEWQLKEHQSQICQIRMDIFLNQAIFQDKYIKKLMQIDKMKNRLSSLNKQRQKQIYYELQRQIKNHIQAIKDQKLIRYLLQYLIRKIPFTVKNQSLIRPIPKMNLLCRYFKKQTIGFHLKRKNNQERLDYKIKNQRKKLSNLGVPKFCYTYDSKLPYYDIMDKALIWEQIYTQSFDQLRLTQIKRLEFDARELNHSNLSKILSIIGASQFNQNEQFAGEEEQDQFTKEKNDILLQKFSELHMNFAMLPTPKSMNTQLKNYQKQALAFMKYREKQISFQQLFNQEQKQIRGCEFQRQLSPLWQEIVLPQNNQHIYINYLTGQFSKKMYYWKKTKGGILADQMGLGKTVMALSLLADQNFTGLNLIVVPVSLLLNWRQQIIKHCGQQVKVYEYHSLKKKKPVDLNEYNVVLTTYTTLGIQYKKQMQQILQNSIFNYNFRRIILDEASAIKSANTLQFNAIFNIQTEYRWCLTGTLINNSEEDLFSIFKFLKIDVFSEEYWWNQYIRKQNCQEAKLHILYTILKPILLRRTKQSTLINGQSILQLQPIQNLKIRVNFSKLQRNIYQKLKKGFKSYFDNKGNRDYVHIFQILTKIRQFCSHPSLIFKNKLEKLGDQNIEEQINKFLKSKIHDENYRKIALSFFNLDQKQQKQEHECPICMEEVQQQAIVITQCGHLFCEPDLVQHLNRVGNCPTCRTPLSSKNGYMRRVDLGNTQADLQKQMEVNDSSKLNSIMQIVKKIQNTQEKCLIFSEWTLLLDIIQKQFKEKAYNYSKLTGSMSKLKRQRQINNFKNSPKCQFFLISIKAGGTGLNLTCANHVIICDQWWNPTHQDQAIGRVHRIGQEKPAKIYRPMIYDSIEEKIEIMHEKKRQLANLVLMQSRIKQQKKTTKEEVMQLLEMSL